MQILQIVLGLALIVISLLDFFYSTLSGNGFGFLSSLLNRGLNWLIIRKKGKSFLNLSGILHLLITTTVWLGLLWLGTLLIFTSGDQMVINGTTHLSADFSDRLYFTGYLLSTLGIGDFIPGNDLGQVFTGILSFSGFVLITTGMTYLLSVVQSVLTKKELAFYIATIGRDVEEIYLYFKRDENLENLMTEAGSIRQLILKNSSSFLAFPMVNYFLTRKRDAALIVQITSLYEVLSVLKRDWEASSVQSARITNLMQAIENYLHKGPPKPRLPEYDQKKLQGLRLFWSKYGYRLEGNPDIDKRFTASLIYSCWSWEDVYALRSEQKKGSPS